MKLHVIMADVMGEIVLERAEMEAVAFLRHYGFVVHPIPRSHEKTPDFEAEINGERYLLEVKSRRDDDAIADVAMGEIFTQSQHLFWSAGVFQNVSKAVRQMRKRDPGHDRIWIAWLAADAPIAGDAAEEQIRGTLLGTRSVIDLTRVNETGTHKDCFYAQRCAFEEFPELDAAVLSGESGYQLWVNEFARPDLVIHSHLGKLLADHGGLNVPQELAEKGAAYRMTPTLDRTDADVLQYLRTAYGLARPILLSPKSHRALGTLPRIG